jgi:hypothetical protein
VTPDDRSLEYTILAPSLSGCSVKTHYRYDNGTKRKGKPEFPAAPGYGYCYRLSSLIFDFHVLIRKGCPDPSELVYYDQISGWSAVLLRDFSL